MSKLLKKSGRNSTEMCTPLILVAEDNALNRRLTCDILKSRGYKVLEVANSRMIVEATRQNKPDLVLLDMSSPGLNPVKIIKKIREDEKLDNIPVLAVADYLAEEDTDFMSQEFDELLAKPTSISFIVSKIDTILAGIKKYAAR